MQNIVGITAYPYNNLRNGDTSALSGRNVPDLKRIVVHTLLRIWLPAQL